MPEINNIIYIDDTTLKILYGDFYHMLAIIYNRSMTITHIYNIKNIIYILNLIHFFDYCKFYKLTLTFTNLSDINKSSQEHINNYLISLLKLNNCLYYAS